MKTTRTSAQTPSSRLNLVKKSLRQRLVEEFQHVVPTSVIRRAVDDAEELAHESGFPALVFPVLAEEKVRLVSAAIVPFGFTPDHQRAA